MSISTAKTIGTKHGKSVPFGIKLSRILCRTRYQLLIGVMTGVIIPNFILYGLPPDLDIWWNTYSPNIISSLIAILIGFLIFRKMSFLPGFSATSNVFPAFAISYGLIASIYFGLRLDLGRNLFLLSFLLLCLSQIMTMFLLSKLHKPIIGVIPCGSSNRLLEANNIDWVVLKDITSAQNSEHLAIAVDLRSDELSSEWETYLAEEVLRGRKIYNAKQLAESIMGRVQGRKLSENYDGHLTPDPIYEALKRYIDIFAAIIALIVLSPLLLIVASMIRLDSKGPSLFVQERIGYRGKPFNMIKFRSMRMSKAYSRTLQNDMTQLHDERITTIGRFIRKTRIDELPQLINIIRGEMSWIGPRPETRRLSEWYAEEIPYYRYRHILRPGISGWAQIRQGHVTDLNDVKNKLEFDLYYIKHFSIWLDITIVLQTVRIVLTGSGAK